MTQQLDNNLFVRAARGERTERTPVWLMRQAGRYDPEYQAIRASHDLPLETLFRTPDIAAEISLLPQRLGVDAIIFYQDILTPLAPMGAEFVFRPGPVLEHPIRNASDVSALRSFDVADEMPFVPGTLRRVRENLAGALPVLGFAGAPLTLAYFLVEGCSFADGASHARALMASNPSKLHTLLNKLTDMTVDYLALQIEAGVDGIQLFESVGDLLSEAEYREFAHPYHERIFARLGDRVPRMLFVKERPWVELMADSGADVLSLGRCIDLADARKRVGHRVALQGNVCNRLVATGTGDEVENAVRECIAAGGHHGHILNLNHGLLRETPIDNVRRFIDTCRTTVLPSVEPHTFRDNLHVA